MFVALKLESASRFSMICKEIEQNRTMLQLQSHKDLLYCSKKETNEFCSHDSPPMVNRIQFYSLRNLKIFKSDSQQSETSVS